MKRGLFFCLAVFLTTVVAVGPARAIAVDEAQLEDPRLEAKAREIMKSIRCLVCQNQSIEDSNADLARDLRQIVRERVAAGDGKEEVHAFLRARYGDWVLLKPPFRGRTLLLWIGPFAILLLGAAGLYFASRRRPVETPPQGLSGEEKEILEAVKREDEA